MNPQSAIDLCREAMLMSMLIGAPVLVIGMLVGLLIGLLQALTQVQDQTVAFVPKLLAMVIALGLSLPWVMQRMLEYSQQLITDIPRLVNGG